ncbi:hypothetical protein [Beijerinckia sp. L45]|uniref:hypothetical protein n=1 Tax=Beijerinckia sp. L45 TaxID=1641855 RepID=UPI00131E36AE|nr:hypothetical protein [Beijerinckia sp. L45]
MVESKGFSRVCLISGSVLTLFASISLPSTAQAGFFDQLFGGSQPSQPEYNQAPPQQQLDTQPEPFVLQQRRIVKRVVADDKPVLQKTTDLLHDKTLRPGDAVMMKTGIHVYTGRETSTHRSADFSPLDQASRLKPNKRIALASMDGTRNDPLAKGSAPDTLSSGRSAAVGTPVVAGVKFTDQRGKTIRYVGP